MPGSSINRLGWVCLALSGCIVALSLPLHCSARALVVASGSGLAGALLGAALAMVTRTRNPLAIYFWLAIVAVTFWPLFCAWPPAGSDDVHAWRGAPDIVSNYFDLLRGSVYLIAIPYPFARFGRHAPDPRPHDPSDP